jgi:predicted nucleotidyltransferase
VQAHLRTSDHKALRLLNALTGAGSELALSRAVAADLYALYGDRLVDVFVFGSHARGDATEESDLDLLVVLDRVDDPWSEHERMEETLREHSCRRVSS